MAKQVTGGRGWRARLVGRCGEHPRRRGVPGKVVVSYYSAPVECRRRDARHVSRAKGPNSGSGGS